MFAFQFEFVRDPKVMLPCNHIFLLGLAYRCPEASHNCSSVYTELAHRPLHRMSKEGGFDLSFLLLELRKNTHTQFEKNLKFEI